MPDDSPRTGLAGFLPLAVAWPCAGSSDSAGCCQFAKLRVEDWRESQVRVEEIVEQNELKWILMKAGTEAWRDVEVGSWVRRRHGRAGKGESHGVRPGDVLAAADGDGTG